MVEIRLRSFTPPAPVARLVLTVPNPPSYPFTAEEERPMVSPCLSTIHRGESRGGVVRP